MCALRRVCLGARAARSCGLSRSVWRGRCDGWGRGTDAVGGSVTRHPLVGFYLGSKRIHTVVCLVFTYFWTIKLVCYSTLWVLFTFISNHNHYCELHYLIYVYLASFPNRLPLTFAISSRCREFNVNAEVLTKIQLLTESLSWLIYITDLQSYACTSFLGLFIPLTTSRSAPIRPLDGERQGNSWNRPRFASSKGEKYSRKLSHTISH